jgi:hypothetical protein
MICMGVTDSHALSNAAVTWRLSPKDLLSWVCSLPQWVTQPGVTAAVLWKGQRRVSPGYVVGA